MAGRNLSLLAAAALLCVAALGSACSALVGDYQLTPEGISTARLCAIERSEFTFELDLASTTQQADLFAYYEAANTDLTTHLAARAQAYSDGASEARVTYVMGAAGVGKSFALRNVDSIDDTLKCELKLGEMFADSPQSLPFEVVQAPDLATLDDQLVFNELPSMADPSALDLSSLLAAAGCEDMTTSQLLPFIVVDGVDEIHPDSSKAILGAIDRFILDGPTGAGPFIHFLVAGRPEGFNGWLTDPGRTEQNQMIVDSFALDPPRYQTAGDIEFRVRNVLGFKELLDEIEASGQLDAYLASVTSALQSHPFLSYSLGNLNVGNEVVLRTGPDANETEVTLKAGLFDDVLQRSVDSHGRPEAGSALGAPYLRLLEEIAVRYIDVRDDGQFEVLSEDVIEVHDDAGAALGQVRVRDVLDRAGVALLTSAVASGSRYRFEPFWIHAHLVERYNQRTIAGYAYHTCQ